MYVLLVSELLPWALVQLFAHRTESDVTRSTSGPWMSHDRLSASVTLSAGVARMICVAFEAMLYCVQSVLSEVVKFRVKRLSLSSPIAEFLKRQSV